MRSVKNAQLQPGAPLVMAYSGMRAALPSAALVITAEGRLDAQTAYGKVVGAVAEAARTLGAPVIALAGSVTLTREELRALGIEIALPLVDSPMSLTDSIRDARRLLIAATERALDLMALGASLRQIGDHPL
jgi:glycerate kinase